MFTIKLKWKYSIATVNSTLVALVSLAEQQCDVQWKKHEQKFTGNWKTVKS